MRTLGLSLLLLCLAATLQGQTPSEPANSKQPVLEGPPPAAGFSTLNYTDDRGPSTAPSDFYCAYMRTYRVKRHHRGSDVVSSAGYTKCVPSNRFEMRSAVQIHTEPAPRE